MTNVIHIAALLHLPSWDVAPSVVLPLIATVVLYISGMRGWRPKSSNLQVGFFISGMLTLAAALLSPLHRLGEELFFAHMAQHEILMLLAAPLLVFSRLDQVIPWALPIEARRKLLRAFHSRPVQSSLVALITHAVAIWGWHIPALYQASIHSELVHAAQHLSFLVTAFWFWWTLFYGMASKREYGMATAYVFVTALHTSILGAILTFSSRIWYPVYNATAPKFGLSTLQDQQLGGLLMWIPANLVYIAIGLWLLRGWILESERRLPLTRLGSLLAEQEERHA